jgi:hypothetical protein
LGKSVNKSSLLTFGNPQLQGVQRPESFVIGLCVGTTLPESLFNLTEIISVQSIHSLAARFEGKQIPHVLFMRAIYHKHTEGIYTSMGCCKALGCIKQLPA